MDVMPSASPAAVEGETFLPPPPLPPFEVLEEAFLPPPPGPADEEIGVPPPLPPLPEPLRAMVEPEPPHQPHAQPAGPEPLHQPHAQPVEPEPPHQPYAQPAEPELVVTMSMAEVFLRQGYRELARAVYIQLAERDPSDPRVAAALTELWPEPASPPAPPPADPLPPPAPEPEFGAASTGGRSVEQLFSSLLSAGRPAVARTVHPPAFESARRPAGETTPPAPESLSLSSVFGEAPAPVAATGGPAVSGEGEPSFDEFYSGPGGAAAETDLPRAASTGSAAPIPAPEDLEQFNAWLRGLKR
jgi:hypothetical protein